MFDRLSRSVHLADGKREYQKFTAHDQITCSKCVMHVLRLNACFRDLRAYFRDLRRRGSAFRRLRSLWWCRGCFSYAFFSSLWTGCFLALPLVLSCYLRLPTCSATSIEDEVRSIADRCRPCSSLPSPLCPFISLPFHPPPRAVRILKSGNIQLLFAVIPGRHELTTAITRTAIMTAIMNRHQMRGTIAVTESISSAAVLAPEEPSFLLSLVRSISSRCPPRGASR